MVTGNLWNALAKKVVQFENIYIGWINNKVLLYNTGNYIQYPTINHNGKEFLKKKVYMHVTESLLYSRCWDNIINQLYFNLGEGNGTPLQYACLENPMDGGAW